MAMQAEKTTMARASEIGGGKDTAVTEELIGVLTGTYRLVIKTHLCHWNITGPQFHAVHEMTETFYKDMFAAADDLAERVRALGRPVTLDLTGAPRGNGHDLQDAGTPAGKMIGDLVHDHQQLATCLRALAETAEHAGDPATADLATERVAFHEKAAWMLGALVA